MEETIEHQALSKTKNKLKRRKKNQHTTLELTMLAEERKKGG